MSLPACQLRSELLHGLNPGQTHAGSRAALSTPGPGLLRLRVAHGTGGGLSRLLRSQGPTDPWGLCVMRCAETPSALGTVLDAVQQVPSGGGQRSRAVLQGGAG